jgi:hypothetical protein
MFSRAPELGQPGDEAMRPTSLYLAEYLLHFRSMFHAGYFAVLLALPRFIENQDADTQISEKHIIARWDIQIRGFA